MRPAYCFPQYRDTYFSCNAGTAHVRCDSGHYCSFCIEVAYSKHHKVMDCLSLYLKVKHKVFESFSKLNFYHRFDCYVKASCLPGLLNNLICLFSGIAMCTWS